MSEMTAQEFHASAETPGAGLVEIRWTFQVKCGPGVPIAETGLWTDRLTVADLPADTTGEGFGDGAARALGAQFLETFLLAMGQKNKVVSISVKDREIPHE